MFVQANSEVGNRKTYWSGRVDLMTHDTAANAYTAPSDGYIIAKASYGTDHGIVRLSADTTNPYFDVPQTRVQGQTLASVCYVVKGTKMYVDSGYKAALTECYYCPLIEY